MIRIGDVVVYHLGTSSDPVNGSEEHPAIVTRVWSEDCVNLRVVFDGEFHDGGVRTSVPRIPMTDDQKVYPFFEERT